MTPDQTNLFDGGTFEHKKDGARLRGQLLKVRELMRDGQWRTLGEIRAVVGGSEAGVSARLRDLRKEKFGARLVERRRRGAAGLAGDPKSGLWEYRVLA
ncbi:MAG: hypothetical protein KA310_03170 [Pseudomonadales bacterium]|nr:hypothetical protein [Pseudomonadales bacterium]